MQARLFFVLVLTLVGHVASAQRYGRNLPDFERKKMHYGTHLGFTYSTYNYKIRPGALGGEDSLQSIRIKGQPGFGIHIPMASWSPVYNFHVRTVLSISFHETVFSYDYWKKGELKTKEHRTEPVRLNFPLQIKLNSNRMDNFGAYALGGFNYSLDLASQHKVAPSTNDPIIRMKQHDFAYEVGGGFDFFLEYFKFGIELKLQNGVRNILIHDDTFYSSPLESLKPRIWWFSFTFET